MSLLIPDMPGNLASAGIGILLDVALISLVVERITTAQRRREWAFAYQVLSECMASTFVDVMRLLYVRNASNAFATNIGRYATFLRIAAFHAALLRSSIESFSSILTPSAHRLIRRTEQHLLWIIDQLQDCPESVALDKKYFAVLEEAADRIIEFIDTEGADSFHHDREIVRTAMASAAEYGYDPSNVEDLNALDRCRLRIQDAILRECRNAGTSNARTIADDYDNQHAIKYFLLDSKLISRAHQLRS
ncbi:hypothetical protein OG785_32145 [Streptomyces sp. NBC_00006]|uniref:hypothetical protein n=1 Tax=Streptomyces sp. NBC_00006 TaxID=2975619 RepID=UPI00224CE912|nr:hypothetical protein [Streptomyces sp. NBC_00006]MCX5535192.1 hypothetical protein [Streptomyces sp. NBC_00006]